MWHRGRHLVCGGLFGLGGTSSLDARLFSYPIAVALCPAHPHVWFQIKGWASIFGYVCTGSFALTPANRRVESTGDEVPRTMPIAERTARRKNVVQRLVGVAVVGVNEPSYKLVDRMASMYESNVLKYVSWEDCTSREQEILSEAGKTDPGKDLPPIAGDFSRHLSALPTSSRMPPRRYM